MNSTLNIQLTEQIQMLPQQDLIRLRLFVDNLIHRQNKHLRSREQKAAEPVRFLANLKPTGIPGSKVPFNRAMIYDDLAI